MIRKRLGMEAYEKVFGLVQEALRENKLPGSDASVLEVKARINEVMGADKDTERTELLAADQGYFEVPPFQWTGEN